MYTRRGTNCQIELGLLDYNDDDENEHLREFFGRHCEFLMELPISEVPHSVLRDISVMLHHSTLFDTDWQDFATTIGIRNNLDLIKIEASAKANNLPPLLILMKAIEARNKKFGHIIVALMELEKYGILRQIVLPYVTELIEGISATGVKGVASVGELPSGLNAKQITNGTYSVKEPISETVVCVKNLSEDNSTVLNTSALNPASMVKQTKKEFNTLQQSSLNNICATGMEIRSSSISSKPLSKESALEEICILPSAPAEEKLSVLIQHTEFDSDIAIQLSQILRAAGITVRTLSDLDSIIVLNATEALVSMFREVDFVVPILTETLYQQIHPKVYEKIIESTDAMNNRTIYDLITNEYRNNNCINYRVRPVIVPEMDRQLFVNDIVLSFSFRLWKEVTKLVKVLKETKMFLQKQKKASQQKRL